MVSLYSINSFSAPVVDLLMVYVIKRYGLGLCGAVAQTSILLGMLSTHLGVFGSEYWMVMLGRLFFGLGLETSILINSAVVEKWFEPKHITQIIAYTRVYFRVFLMLAAYTLPMLYIEEGDFMPVMVGFEVVGVLSLIGGLFYYWVELRFESTKVDGEGGVGALEEPLVADFESEGRLDGSFMEGYGDESLLSVEDEELLPGLKDAEVTRNGVDRGRGENDDHRTEEFAKNEGPELSSGEIQVLNQDEGRINNGDIEVANKGQEDGVDFVDEPREGFNQEETPGRGLEGQNYQEPENESDSQPGAKEDQSSSEGTPNDPDFGMRHLMHIPRVIYALIALITVSGGCYYQLTGVGTDLMQMRYSMTYRQAKNVMAVFPALSLITILIMIPLMRRVGQKPIFFLAGSSLYFVSHLIFSLLPAQNPGWLLYLPILLINFGNSMIFSLADASILLVSPTKAVTFCAAMVAIGFNSSAIFISPVTGFVSQARTVQTYQNCFYMFMGISFVCFCVTLAVFWFDKKDMGGLLARRDADPEIEEYKKRANQRLDDILVASERKEGPKKASGEGVELSD